MTSKLITPESPLLVPPLLASEIGLEEAVILQQIHYFCQISKHIKRDGRRWFWKTLKDWGETLPFLLKGLQKGLECRQNKSHSSLTLLVERTLIRT
ncbi:hypothetical protein [Nostoc sp. FACHB-145]|uniref:hypothetical protein n=1 Tax=Nostoc sp. FACHB-145 TaxID=2692836 RepID=UPI001F552D48|nr:hypothetical protein [Nostoc sp. FACHB-145]